MVDPIDNTSSSSTGSKGEVGQNLRPGHREGSDFSRGSAIYQLAMRSALQSIMDRTNQVQKQAKQNAEEGGEPDSTITSF
ncbi:MAG: hypothetical protein AAGE99_01420 [Chlamydiota bacterium]